jgi:hypothetical protein
VTAVCQKSKHNKLKNSPKNAECPAYIHIRVKNVSNNNFGFLITCSHKNVLSAKLTDSTQARDNFIKSGYQQDGISRRVEILIHHHHSHHMLNADALKDNKMLPSAVRNLNAMFQSGTTPMDAKKAIAADLKEKAAASSSPSKYTFSINYLSCYYITQHNTLCHILAKGKVAVALADGGLHPKTPAFYYRHKVFTEKQFGKIDGSPIDAVSSKISSGFYTNLGMYSNHVQNNS